jgi:hypothetical protein
MNQGNIKNKVNLPNIEPRPSNDNIVAQFLGNIGSIGQGLVSGIGQVGAGVGQAIGQAGTGLATGIEQGVGLIGQGVSEMNKTPEGRLALRELVGAALRGVGQEDLGVGVQQYAQRVYTPEAQRALYETQQRAETKKAERKAVSDLQEKGFQQISPQKQKNIPQQYITQVPVGNKKVSFVNQKALKEDLESANIEFNKTKQAKDTFDKAIQNIDELISQKKDSDEYQTTDLGKYLAIESEGFAEAVESPGEMFARKFGAKGKTAQASLKSLRAKLAFEELRKMREASKTGGALGNVTEGELELLQLAGADITEGMSEKEFVKRIVRLRNQLTEARQKLPKSKDEILLQMSGQEMPRIGWEEID